jgi:CheY-like chemotaxis protein
MLKILTVDDNQTQRKMMITLLQRAGFEVTAAASGNEAVSRSITDAPDAILLDISLPGTSGYEVCKRIKVDVRTGLIPIIFYTGEMDGAAKNHADMVGAAAFLTYPVELSQLKTVIESVVAKTRLREHRVR